MFTPRSFEVVFTSWVTDAETSTVETIEPTRIIMSTRARCPVRMVNSVLFDTWKPVAVDERMYSPAGRLGNSKNPLPLLVASTVKLVATFRAKLER